LYALDYQNIFEITMSHPIVENTKLQCNKGTKQTPIKVTSQNFAKINSLLQATEQDKQPNVNIQSFGKCAVTRKTCKPAPTAWQKTSPFSIDDKKELTTDSFCMCALGGKITPLSPSDSSFESIE